MNDKPIRFGDYLNKKRKALMTLRAFAAKVGKVPGYISDVENSRRDPPAYDVLVTFADVLYLSEADCEIFFDLAGKGRDEVSPDLPDYIMKSEVADSVRMALRTAKNSKASVEDWLRFVEEMKNKERKE